jgi:hypothetical protein
LPTEFGNHVKKYKLKKVHLHCDKGYDDFQCSVVSTSGLKPETKLGSEWKIFRRAYALRFGDIVRFKLTVCIHQDIIHVIKLDPAI